MVAAPGSLRGELARKAVHLATAALPVAWAQGVLTAQAVRTSLSAAVVVALGVEAVRRWHGRSAELFTSTVGWMLRPHEGRHLTGATWLAAAMAACAWFAPQPAAIAALWAAAVGDASAAVVGRSLAARRGTAHDAGKSLIGSAAAAASTALGCRWLVGASWPVATALGIIAALAEWPRRPLDDNLRVAAAVAIAAVAFGLR